MLIWQGKQKPAKQRSLRFRQYEIAFEIYAAGVEPAENSGTTDVFCRFFPELVP